MRSNRHSIFLKTLILVIYASFLFGCSETTFLLNSAKRIGSWGDNPTYKVGNPYKINGKWYYPSVDYSYKETGIASWYGPGFHGKKTANGEVFNQNKISAAHRTLPMPSIVKVTNLDNGRVLERVRINDRGPFAGNRIIDLSKKAAEELGFVHLGIANVTVEILEEESREHAIGNTKYETFKAESAEVKAIKKSNIKEIKQAENSPNETVSEVQQKIDSDNVIFGNKPLAIQVGAFTDHRNAKSLANKLSDFKACTTASIS